MNNFNKLGINFTFKCAFSCAHCINNSSPKNTAVVSPSFLNKFLSGLDVGLVKEVSISGGEPFLFLNRLAKLLKILSKKKIRTVVITNSYWCSNYDETLETLRKIKFKDLFLLTSLNRFHLKFGNLDNLGNFLRACKHLRIACGVNVLLNDPDVKRYKRFVRRLNNDAKVSVFTLKRIGRAKESLFFKRKNISEFTSCLAARLNLNPLGQASFCCINPKEFSPKSPLLLGNYKHRDISILLRIANSSNFIRFYTKYGPFGIYSILPASLKSRFSKKYADGCEFCLSLFKDKDVCRFVNKIF